MEYRDDEIAEMSELEYECRELIDKIKKTAFEELRKENEELRGKLARLEAIEKVYKDWENEKQILRKAMEKDKNDAISQLKKNRIKELFGDNFVTGYAIDFTRIEKDCPMCHGTQKIELKDALGKIYKVDCPYCWSIKEYKVIKVKLLELLDNTNNVISRYYGGIGDENKKWVYKETHDEKPFEDINVYDAVFTSDERAEEFCKWLNEKEQKKWAERATALNAQEE